LSKPLYNLYRGNAYYWKAVAHESQNESEDAFSNYRSAAQYSDWAFQTLLKRTTDAGYLRDTEAGNEIEVAVRACIVDPEC
jgi:hypothetical protein